MLYKLILLFILAPITAFARTAPVAKTYAFVKNKARLGVLRTRYGNSNEITRAIFAESDRYGFDPLLVAALIEHESGFGVRTRGTHGEIGLMQVKPRTARWIAERIGVRFRGNRTLENPAVNVRFGLAYLDFLREKFARQGSHFLAAYNMGQGNALRAIGQGRAPSSYAVKVLWRYRSFSSQLAVGTA